MQLSDLRQHDLLRFCESSEHSDSTFDLDQLLSSAQDEYESQSASGPASETPNPAPTTSPTPKADSLHRKQLKMFKKRGGREYQTRLSKTRATVSECGTNGGATGDRLVVTQFPPNSGTG